MEITYIIVVEIVEGGIAARSPLSHEEELWVLFVAAKVKVMTVAGGRGLSDGREVF